MERPYIALSYKASPRLGAQWNILEHFLLGVVRRVVTWSDLDVVRTSRSVHIFDAYPSEHEPAANLLTDFNDFPDSPACVTVLALRPGVDMHPLLNLQYFADSALEWTVESQCATESRVSVMNTMENFVDQVCNIQYIFTVAK